MGYVNPCFGGGNCWDNAPQESLFGHMKDEIHLNSSDGHNVVTQKVLDWIDYYNNERYQWSLAKLSPVEYYRYVMTGEYPIPVTGKGLLVADGALPPNPRSLTLLFPEKARKKTKLLPRLPRKPDKPLGSLSSVALSCLSVKQTYYTTELALGNQTCKSCPNRREHFRRLYDRCG